MKTAGRALPGIPCPGYGRGSAGGGVKKTLDTGGDLCFNSTQTDEAESKPTTRLQRAGGAVIPAANEPVWMDR